MARKVTSKRQKEEYSVYKVSARWKANRERKLLAQIKRNPNNSQLPAALKNIVYRRKTPKTSVWSKSKKEAARLIKEFCGKCPASVFYPSKGLDVYRKIGDEMHTVANGKKYGNVSFSIKGRCSNV